MDYFLHQKPFVIRNKIESWKMLKYKAEEWLNIFQDKVLLFRQGTKACMQTPFWERLCNEKAMTLHDFFNLSKNNKENWFYFDYKYVKDVFPENDKLFDEIKWSDIGLVNVSGKDSTIWIGNEGAHTPCHLDTYGCNFVAQIFGRKLWILMPPEETEVLGPVRVPYEESSIYSSHGFYTPNYNLLDIKKAYKVILSPGDVLFVPRHWWHYVENLEVAISINVWIPLEVDDESRLTESLVRQYVSSICQDLSEEEAKEILNPNEHSLLQKPFFFESVGKFIENCREFRKKNGREIFKNCSINLNEFPVVEINELDLSSYVREKSKIHNYDPSSENESKNKPNDRLLLAKNLINSYCHPRNVEIVKETLLTKFSSPLELVENNKEKE